jgi:pimeloyl-ACP methyl ester carboxylesterase
MKNYRREVLLSRALAARGLLCARFHYRGVGHSRGLSAHIDISRMVDDAAALSEVLRSEFGITTLVLVGTRLGALAATRAAARTAADGLVLWDPVLDPAKYFKEIMRARLMTEIRSGGGGTTEQLLEEMRTAGFVDVLGFAVLQEIYEEALTSSLAEEVGNTEIPTLAVAFSRSGEVAPDLAECGAQWRSSGRDVDIEAFRFAEAWWFTEEISRLDLPGKESAPLVRLTADWFTDRFVVGPVAA